MSAEYKSLPVAALHANLDFNCRDIFTSDSVVDLAADIQERTLLFPLLVRPMCEVPPESQHEGFEWSILAGFRRFTAISDVLMWKEVPCLIRYGLSEEVAKSINLAENLKREDLSPIEVARAIRKHYPGKSLRYIGDLIDKSYKWVERRLKLLDLPVDIQSAIDSGRVTVSDASRILDQGKTAQEQLDIFHELIKPRRSKPGIIKVQGKLVRTRRYRTYEATRDLIGHIMEYGEACGMSEEHMMQIGKVLLWTMNRVETEELLDILNLPQGLSE